MNLPPLTAKQFAVLNLLMGVERSGRALREMLNSDKVRTSRAAFYLLMARMEDQGFVTTRSVPIRTEKQTYHEHYYKLTGAGSVALSDTERFYLMGRMELEHG